MSGNEFKLESSLLPPRQLCDRAPGPRSHALASSTRVTLAICEDHKKSFYTSNEALHFSLCKFSGGKNCLTSGAVWGERVFLMKPSSCVSLEACHREVHLLFLKGTSSVADDFKTWPQRPLLDITRSEGTHSVEQFNSLPCYARQVGVSTVSIPHTDPRCYCHAVWMDLTPLAPGLQALRVVPLPFATVVQEWTCDLTWPKQRDAWGFSLNVCESISPLTGQGNVLPQEMLATIFIPWGKPVRMRQPHRGGQYGENGREIKPNSWTNYT